jgi:hypothetical protein
LAKINEYEGLEERHASTFEIFLESFGFPHVILDVDSLGAGNLVNLKNYDYLDRKDAFNKEAAFLFSHETSRYYRLVRFLSKKSIVHCFLAEFKMQWVPDSMGLGS